MAVAAAPAVAAAAPAAEAVAARAVAGRAAAGGARARASSSGAKKVSTTKKPPAKKAPAKKTPPGGGKGGGGGKEDLLGGAGGGGDDKKKGTGEKKGKQGEQPTRGERASAFGKKSLQGSKGKYRRILVAEFLVCSILLLLSPLAKGDGEMTPGHWMKRGSATAAFFIILGLVSSFGAGAGRAAAAFGGLVTLVLVVDQREAFGKLATLLNTPDTPASTASAVGPPDSTDVPTSVEA